MSSREPTQSSRRSSRTTRRRKDRSVTDALKQQIAEYQKKLTRLQKQKQEVLGDDDEATNYIRFFNLEHDELLRQDSIARQEIKDLETILQNRLREIDEIKEVTAAEIKIYQKKVKHLMASNANQLAETQIETKDRLFMQRQAQLMETTEPAARVEALRSDTNDMQVENNILMKNHRMKHDKAFTELREEFEERIAAMKAAHELRVKTMRDQLEEKRNQLIKETENRKNEQIRQLQEKNASDFDRIKNYFSNIIHSNLELIKRCKQKIASRKKDLKQLNRQVNDLLDQKAKIEAPLMKLTAENEKLSAEIVSFEQLKKDLARSKQEIRVLEDKYKDLQLSQEVLAQRFEQLETERNSIYSQFEDSIHDVRQKTEFRAFVLEQKVKKLNEELESKEMQLQQVMQESGIDSTAISAKIEDVLASKNAKINQLELNLAKVRKAHNEILEDYQRKMEHYGIPQDDIGFSTLPESAQFCDPTLTKPKE